METTKLSTLLARMNRWQAIYRGTEEQYLVYDLDESLRNLKRTHATPWTIIKSTLRVFSDVFEYPQASDHMVLAYLEGQEEGYGNKPRPYYTSMKEFNDDFMNRSAIAEIWDQGTPYLGVRNNNLANSNQVIDECELDDGYTISGDITAKAIDNVIYKSGNGSLRLTIVNSSNTALLEKSFTGITDAVYQRKYVFFKLYLSAAPTSITLRFGSDSSNYLYKTVTTQFSGQAFKANDFNWVAIDLNNPTGTTGTISTATIFDYYAVQFTGAASGLYYLDQVSLKGWALMDYVYYGRNTIKTVAATVADQEFFMDADGVYSTDSELVGPEEFADVVMYDAMISTLTDTENKAVLTIITGRRDKAWDLLTTRYPSLEPLIMTYYWRFGSQMTANPASLFLDRDVC